MLCRIGIASAFVSPANACSEVSVTVPTVLQLNIELVLEHVRMPNVEGVNTYKLLFTSKFFFGEKSSSYVTQSTGIHVGRV
jgi:hypothetical protein